MDKDDLFAEFMRDYIEVQSDNDADRPWYMSMDVLSQAFASFIMSVKKETKIIYNVETETYKRLQYYIDHNKTNIRLFGIVKLSGEPRLTVTGVRLKRIPL